MFAKLASGGVRNELWITAANLVFFVCAVFLTLNIAGAAEAVP